MENTKLRPVEEQNGAEESSGKALRISNAHRAMLDKGRTEINKDSTYKKKISYCRYVEKLIEDYWEKPIEELKKEREGSKDWLELEYKREAPNMSFFDWVRLRVEGNQKKSVKRNDGGKK